MAKFLTASGTSYQLEELIKQAHERLYIISPFLKFNPRIKALLEDQDRMKADIRIVYGKSELAPQEMNWLRDLKSIRTYYLEDLHAKCYMNENGAIITSMNLYQYSQVNNDEMGVYFTKDDDPELYRDALAEAQRLIRTGEERLFSAEKSEQPKPFRNQQTRAQPSATPASPISKVWDALKATVTGGKCIRCNKQIDYNLDKPLCPDCFRAWNRYQDPSYVEHYCHRCGREFETTIAKPLCLPCYRTVN